LTETQTSTTDFTTEQNLILSLK